MEDAIDLRARASPRAVSVCSGAMGRFTHWDLGTPLLIVFDPGQLRREVVSRPYLLILKEGSNCVKEEGLKYD